MNLSRPTDSTQKARGMYIFMNTEKMTEYLDSLEKLGIPSVDCIVYEDHKEIYRHMNGYVDAEKTKKVQGNEQYLMFSMTKLQTMTALMQLVEQGKISLEDEVAKYLPAYSDIYVLEDGKKVKSDVAMKIKHLASMQSGLDYNLEREGIKRVLKEKGQQATTREIVDAFVETPLSFKPGEHFQYSLSHDVVAAIIEVVSGMSFGEYLKKNIWEPLKMNRTFFAKPMNEGVENLVPQFIQNEKGIVPMDMSCCYQLSENYESGGAGLISCLEDYIKLGDCLACGGISAEGIRILKPDTIELMKQNQLSEVGRADIANSLGRRGYGYGCGVQVLLDKAAANASAATGVFGWDGAAGSTLIMDTVSKRSIVFTMHVRNCGMAYSVIHPTLRDFVF